MDDKIITNCSSCNGQFRIPAKYAGKTIKCPKCQQPLEIPNVSVQAPPAAPPPMAPPPMAPPQAIPPQSDSVKISAWDKAKPAPPKTDGMRKAPAPKRQGSGSNVGRAPSRPGSRTGSRAGSRTPSKTRQGSKSGVRGRSSGVRDGRRGYRDDMYETPKKNNMPMIIGISAAGLVLLIVIIAVMFSGRTTTTR